MPSGSHNLVHHRLGDWLPKDQSVLDSWFRHKVDKAKARNRKPEEWHPVVQEFRRLIESDPDIYMSFHEMFDQEPDKPPYNQGPTGQWKVRGPHLLYVYSVV